MENESGTWVPASELYSELRRLSDLVTRLDERLVHDKTPEHVAELTVRVTALEQRMWRASGVAAALGGLIGVAVPFIAR